MKTVRNILITLKQFKAIKNILLNMGQDRLMEQHQGQEDN